MNVNTHLEDLSNEIFFEIFDYLHIFDIFTGFTSLNRRISSILRSIPLHIVISREHRRHQIDFLSSHLTFHEDQVISIKVSDTISDDSFIISLLFNRHKFSNLKSCKLMSINSTARLGNVIEQIRSLSKLVLFKIIQPRREDLNDNDNDKFTRMILTHKSSFLHSVELQYPYHYLNISNYASLASNLTSLTLRITGSPSTVSIHSILRVFHLCHKIRYLCIALYNDKRFENNHINVPNDLPGIIENDYPTLTQLTSFELMIDNMCDIWSISFILRCMPNLKHFYFYLLVQTLLWPFTNQYLDGYIWQQMLELHVPCLSKFEFNMTIKKRLPKLDLDFVIDSFKYFVNKYSKWDMIIDRWRCGPRHREEFVILQTLNYTNRKSTTKTKIPFITCGTFETRSTRKTTDDHYSFYSDITDLKLKITNKRFNVTWSSPLFQHITYLLVEMPITKSSWWNNLFNIVNLRETTDDNAQQNLTYLSRFVHLPNVTKIEFGSTYDVDQWKDIQCILKACSNIIILIISTPLLVASKLIDNSSLFPIFKEIKMIKSITEKRYFPSIFAFKFVERFPSLIHIELKVYSFDNCACIIDLFLIRLEQLSYLKIYYDQDTLFDDPFSHEYIVTRRLQAFPNKIIDERMVNVKNNGQIMEIWLS